MLTIQNTLCVQHKALFNVKNIYSRDDCHSPKKPQNILLTGDLVSHISQPSLQSAVLRLSFSQWEVSMCRSQFLRDSCALSLFSPSFHPRGTGHKEASERRGLVPGSLFGGRMAAKQESPVWTGTRERGKTPVHLRVTHLRVLFVAKCSSSPRCSPSHRCSGRQTHRGRERQLRAYLPDESQTVQPSACHSPGSSEVWEPDSNWRPSLGSRSPLHRHPPPHLSRRQSHYCYLHWDPVFQPMTFPSLPARPRTQTESFLTGCKSMVAPPVVLGITFQETITAQWARPGLWGQT